MYMRNAISNDIRAGYPGIYLVSCEETRIEAVMKAIAQNLKYRLFAWSITEGLVDTSDGHTQSAQDPIELMAAVDELPENTVLLLKDFHQFLEDGNPVLVRKVKESLRGGKTKGRAVVIVGCRFA